MAIDEVKQRLYLAYANAPDPDAQTVEERRSQYIVVESYPILHKPKADVQALRQMVVSSFTVAMVCHLKMVYKHFLE